jgi:hypothetical protein
VTTFLLCNFLNKKCSNISPVILYITPRIQLDRSAQLECCVNFETHISILVVFAVRSDAALSVLPISFVVRNKMLPYLVTHFLCWSQQLRGKHKEKSSTERLEHARCRRKAVTSASSSSQQPKAGQGRLIIKVSRSHTPQSLGPLLTGNRPDAEIST